MGNGEEEEREWGGEKKTPLNCSVLLQTMRLEAGLIRADGICERLERISEGLITGEDKRGQASYKIPFFLMEAHESSIILVKEDRPIVSFCRILLIFCCCSAWDCLVANRLFSLFFFVRLFFSSPLEMRLETKTFCC